MNALSRLQEFKSFAFKIMLALNPGHSDCAADFIHIEPLCAVHFPCYPGLKPVSFRPSLCLSIFYSKFSCVSNSLYFAPIISILLCAALTS